MENIIIKIKNSIKKELDLRNEKRKNQEIEYIKSMFHFIIDKGDVYIATKEVVIYKCDMNLSMMDNLKVMERFIDIAIKFGLSKTEPNVRW